ncbi:MAG: hypothetical protein MHMPM18_000182 [Marteilia pararefringens]
MEDLGRKNRAMWQLTASESDLFANFASTQFLNGIEDASEGKFCSKFCGFAKANLIRGMYRFITYLRFEHFSGWLEETITFEQSAHFPVKLSFEICDS